jgi:hypothetical protein
MDSTRQLLWKRSIPLQAWLKHPSRRYSSARRQQERCGKDSVAIPVRLIGDTSGASAGLPTESRSIKTSQRVYIRWYGSSKPRERSIHRPTTFSQAYGAASKNGSGRASAYAFKRLHLGLDGNGRLSTPSASIPAMRATETELTWHMRSTLFPTVPQRRSRGCHPYT